MPDISVVVRSRDEAHGIGRTLELIAEQEYDGAVEAIVVDSGSTDDTVAIARSHGARVIEIPAESFTYGGSLNTGCQAASGELLVALSAHAYPRERDWLARAAAHFADARVACASGQPRGPDGSPLSTPIIQDAGLARRRPRWGYSNAAGMFRADLFSRRAFRADMPATEDKAWVLHWLDQGYVCVLDPGLVVDHDHSKDPLREQFRRARREVIGEALMLGAAEPLPASTVAARWWRDQETYRNSARSRLSHRRAARLLGEFAGARSAARADLRDPATPGRRLCVVTDVFPVASETFVVNEIAELRRQGHTVTVEATNRPPAATGATERVNYLVADPRAGKALDLARLAARHPVRLGRDVVARRRWAREEDVRPLRALASRALRLRRAGIEHVHVHFAAGAALDSMRLAAILGLPYSVTAHAYEIFASPTNLEEKLRRAAFVTSGCEYNVRHLRAVAGAEAAARVHEIVMGVDTEFFRRQSPYPGGSNVLVVGRLVEKKGFRFLLDAVASLEPDRAPEGVTIVGDGPLRAGLEAQAAELGLGDRVAFAGEADPAEVRAQLERADVLVMPCVIAADGDRDSMPVVVKEALAMEVPVVASDEVGLPEVVQTGWGRLAAPGDAESLAGALAELLVLPGAERAAMGRSGREFVIASCSLERETRKLTGLIEAA
ncbi:MAG: colanic acid/amylovoran biosynthesis glycosyltransferase [Solirubrobacterales bacterium]|nr:colanic acid/amylovoran biosynthesis glycosyltransferase [Solirubrobacterales bacterium]